MTYPQRLFRGCQGVCGGERFREPVPAVFGLIHRNIQLLAKQLQRLGLRICKDIGAGRTADAALDRGLRARAREPGLWCGERASARVA